MLPHARGDFLFASGTITVSYDLLGPIGLSASSAGRPQSVLDGFRQGFGSVGLGSKRGIALTTALQVPLQTVDNGLSHANFLALEERELDDTPQNSPSWIVFYQTHVTKMKKFLSVLLIQITSTS